MQGSEFVATVSWAELVGYLLLINVMGYVMVRRGVLRQVVQGIRLPLPRLLSVAMLGGAIGALAGMKRYATFARRSPLRLGLRAIILAQLALILLLSTPLGPRLAGMLPGLETGAVQFADQLTLETRPPVLAARSDQNPIVLGWKDGAAQHSTGPIWTSR